MNRIKITDTTNNAWKANRENALKGFDLKAAQMEIARKVAAFIQNEEKTREIDAIDDERFVAMMRELGGFAKVVTEYLPAEVAATPSGHGVPTNPDWFRRDALVSTVGQITNLVKGILNEPAAPDPDSKFVFVKAGDVPPDAVKDSKRSFDIIGKSDTVGVFVNFVNLDDLEVLLECDHVVTIERPVTPDEIPASFFCKGCQCGVMTKTITRRAFDSYAANRSPV